MPKLTKKEKISIAILALVNIVAIFLIHFFLPWNNYFIFYVSCIIFFVMDYFVADEEELKESKLYKSFKNFYVGKKLIVKLIFFILWFVLISGFQMIFQFCNLSLFIIIFLVALEYILLYLGILVIRPAFPLQRKDNKEDNEK